MTFDFVMPLTLFVVTVVAMLLEKRVEGKLKGALEEREFRVRDVVLLVAAMSVTISLIVFVPQMAVMVLFLFSYSMLLFIFAYLFSDFKKARASLFCVAFLVASFLAAVICLFIFSTDNMVVYGALAFFGIFGFAFVALLYEQNRVGTEERLYLAVLPPALFIFLYLFFGRTPLWFPYLLDLYGIVFAVLITLYLGSLFSWNTALIFAGLLTAMDVILVLVTGSMISAASHVSGLRLPVLVSLPTVPAVVNETGSRLFMGLGLGDFFFAGLLAIQTFKKYGKGFVVESVVGMALSFFVFEAYLLTYELRAFPGTLMIICGWLPLVIGKRIAKFV